MSCTAQRCDYRFVLENKPLSSVHLSHYVELVVTVSVRNGLVVRREIDYGREAGLRSQFEYDVIDSSVGRQELISRGLKDSGLSRLNVDQNGLSSTVRVRLNSQSSADQRNRAYAIDLTCLAWPFSCGSPSKMFPKGIPYQGPPNPVVPR